MGCQERAQDPFPFPQEGTQNPFPLPFPFQSAIPHLPGSQTLSELLRSRPTLITPFPSLSATFHFMLTCPARRRGPGRCEGGPQSSSSPPGPSRWLQKGSASGGGQAVLCQAGIRQA